ncbi:MAG TPA: YihY/virulence factor BrkB family protein [Anaeromyxobacter sp.]
MVERVRTYLSLDLWGERAGELPHRRAFLNRTLRVGYSALRGFRDHQLTFRAAALTYYTVLSIVPFLAFAFAVLKGFGAYRLLMDGTVRPWLGETFGANPALLDAIQRVLDFVDATDVSKLGVLGLLMLVYTSISLVSSVETALNQIWGAKTSRPFVRQVTDYITLLVTTPLLVLVAATFSTAAQSSRVVAFLREALHLGPVIDLALGLAPVVVVFVALFAMYMILPNVPTRAVSAAVGAALAAVAWQGALVLHVQSQRGAASYNALYSVLGAIPIFLVWTYVSWLVVLCGAELAASHQNEQALRQTFLARRADQALKETLAVACGVRVARDFLLGRPPRSAAQIAELLCVPPPLLEEVLDALARSGIAARTLAGHEIRWLPARDPGSVRANDLREALRRDPGADGIREGVERSIGDEVASVLAGLDEEVRRSPMNPTLRDLALRAIPRGEAQGARRPPRGPPPRPGSAIDPKQPDVPR